MYIRIEYWLFNFLESVLDFIYNIYFGKFGYIGNSGWI